MVTINTHGKNHVATITNRDFLKFTGLEKMPDAFWERQAMNRDGHANPIFHRDEDYLYCAMNEKKKTHRIIGDELIPCDE